MKKSLNNKIRGKRLVMGDENEVTSHELLVEDKDGKIAIKQRGADGKMESVSGGGANSYNILYYTTASKDGSTVNWRKEVPYINLLDFATGECDKRIIEGIDEGTLTSKETHSKRKVTVQATLCDFIDSVIDKDNQIIYENINIPNNQSDIIIPKYSFSSDIKDSSSAKKIPVTLSISGYENSQHFGIVIAEPYPYSKESSPFIETTVYDPVSNVLSYYSAASGSAATYAVITIDPKLAESLKIHYWGYRGAFNRIYINGKEIEEDRNFEVSTTTM